uniref:Retrovirus-related Pol polyprotein from transposon TNT 1-94 n=1 Tax=Tanacetum cinerariifolium TaxID=118510 RepID=A0A6L2MJN1_TANCI|nr:retrovirus-related Pol polyprotein from transposon TNT 1-94 [Tanacetum cinerariifolium]
MNPWGGGAAGYGGVQNRVRNANPSQVRQVKYYNCNGTGYIGRNCTQPKHPQNSKYYKDKMLLMQAQENGVALDAEQLLFLAGGHDNAIDDDVDEKPVQDLALNVDNVFQADDCDVFDSDVDEALTAQTMFMANLSFADPVTDEAGPSYDSNILSEVQVHDHYQDVVWAHHEEHTTHHNVQLNHVVYSHVDYTSNSNMILYDQYAKDNTMPVVHKKVEDRLLKRELLSHIHTTEAIDPRANVLVSKIKLKSEALKEKTTVSRPIKALMMYPPNTPATLVPRVLPTKSQMKIHIFTLI